MKKIMNRPERLVVEMCKGICLCNPELRFLESYKVVYRTPDPDKVTLISGGGCGHEPAHAGYVGEGMLDAAVCGDVFASPSQIQVYHAIRQTQSPKGTLLIIKNYSGDVMNFQNAAAMAAEDGILVDSIKVEDDIAVQDSLYTVGRRGVAGTVLVHKVAGAAAAEGRSLEEVKRIAQHAADSVRSIGFALTSCTVPASGVPTFDIGPGEMEYGVGIHGEPGRKREAVLPADALAARMTGQVVEDLKIRQGDEVTVLVNGFGGTPLQELYLLNHSVCRALTQLGVRVYRCFAGNYMTSIDMQGASISLMKMDASLKHCIDKPCKTLGFRVDGPASPVWQESEEDGDEQPHGADEMRLDEACKVIRDETLTLENIVAMVKILTECAIENEVPFCKLDSYAGDGDFGMSVAKGFLQVRRLWDTLTESRTIGEFLKACSLVIMEHCGGASGPIWGSAFRAAGVRAGDAGTMCLNDFAEMMQAAVCGIQKTGARSFGRGAQVGDKTLIDALIPCAEALRACADRRTGIHEALECGAQAAVQGAENTKGIVAHMGRAGTVGERSLGYPDAGAYALGVLFTEVARNMK